MSARFQRLLLIFFSLIFLATAVILVLFNSKKNLVYFYTPTELLNSNTDVSAKVRIGGFVKKNSINMSGENQYDFIITDNKNELNISYNGLLPDLFREEQGVVIEGELIINKNIKASMVFAKHDENYIPANLKKQLKKSQYWKKEYE
jgi:cytochrome c-type biogenesis protein CcmE